MSGLINWDILLDLILPGLPPKAGLWDDFAAKYDGFANLEEEFTALQIAAMRLDATDTVLDIGAGPGRITIPVAKQVQSITALDSSPGMQEILRKNTERAGLTNVNLLLLDWQEAVVGSNLPQHDVVIASRSPGMRDLAKLNAAARKRCYLLTFAGPSLKNFHDELMEGVQDSPPAPRLRKNGLSPHVLMFNQLADMGIDANVQYVPDGFTRWYKSREQAYEDLSWLIVPPEKESRFRANVDRYLNSDHGGFRLLKRSKTVILSWDKEA